MSEMGVCSIVLLCTILLSQVEATPPAYDKQVPVEYPGRVVPTVPLDLQPYEDDMVNEPIIVGNAVGNIEDDFSEHKVPSPDSSGNGVEEFFGSIGNWASVQWDHLIDTLTYWGTIILASGLVLIVAGIVFMLCWFGYCCCCCKRNNAAHQQANGNGSARITHRFESNGPVTREQMRDNE